MNSIEDLDQRLIVVENALNAAQQIANLPTKIVPGKDDIVNIQVAGINYQLPLKHLINSIYVLPASETLIAGSFVNVWSDGGIVKVRLANASTNRKADAFVLIATSVGTNANVYFAGINDQQTLLTAGESYFLSETPGGITTIPLTSGAGKISQYIGKAVSTSEIMFQPTQPVELS